MNNMFGMFSLDIVNMRHLQFFAFGENLLFKFICE